MGAGHHHTHLHVDSHAGHRHGEGTGALSSQTRTTRALVIAVAVTLGYGVGEAMGGVWAGSLALLADAGHMATDSAALLFALAASLIARQAPTDRHSYGLARVEVVAAFVNALAMLAISAVTV